MYTHRIEDLTVIATDESGEDHDLNATGEPCTSSAELAEFVQELHCQGAFDAATRDSLIREVLADGRVEGGTRETADWDYGDLLEVEGEWATVAWELAGCETRVLLHELTAWDGTDHSVPWC